MTIYEIDAVTGGTIPIRFTDMNPESVRLDLYQRGRPIEQFDAVPDNDNWRVTIPAAWSSRWYSAEFDAYVVADNVPYPLFHLSVTTLAAELQGVVFTLGLSDTVEVTIERVSTVVPQRPTLRFAFVNLTDQTFTTNWGQAPASVAVVDQAGQEIETTITRQLNTVRLQSNTPISGTLIIAL